MKDNYNKIKLVFASQNPHKLTEVNHAMREAFGQFNAPAMRWEIIALDQICINEDIPETQSTLEGNALQKARFVFERTGFNCFADDTGLEIDALDGRPGVYSARYAGNHKSFDDNIKKVLKELEGIENRSARFRTVIALIINNETCFFEGSVEGVILHEKRGSQGFGYDPVFLPVGHSKTFAEMSLDEKNQLSHRAIAVKKLCTFLASYPLSH